MASAASLSLSSYGLAQFEAQQGDVTLVLGEGDNRQNLMAHSFILGRAEYFASALKTSYQEGQTRKIELPDVSPVPMKALIRSLYTDNFDHLKSGFGIDQLFSLCELADRFLVPEVASKGVYDRYAESVVSARHTCREYVDIFVKLVGMRIPSSALTTLVEGLGEEADGECSAEDLLSLVVEARSKEVSTHCQEVLKSSLMDFVAVGNSVASTAVLAVNEGLLDLADEALRDSFELVPAIDFATTAEREHKTLRLKAKVLSEDVWQRLRLRFAVKALPKLMAACTRRIIEKSKRADLIRDVWLLDPRRPENLVSQLVRDIEEVTAATLPLIADTIPGRDSLTRPPKRPRVA